MDNESTVMIAGLACFAIGLWVLIIATGLTSMGEYMLGLLGYCIGMFGICFCGVYIPLTYIRMLRNSIKDMEIHTGSGGGK